MKKSFYPVLMSKNIRGEADFFKELFAFKEIFSSDWYISLIDDDNFEIAIISNSHETIPEFYRKKCQGVIINIEVDNVDNLYSKISERKEVSILLDIKNEDFGQRHFIIESPSQILIDIIQVIPPSEDYEKNYKKIEG